MQGQGRWHAVFVHRPRLPRFRKEQTNREQQDESHLSPEEQNVHVHPALSVLLLVLGAWMSGFPPEMLLQLQFVSGQCTWQDHNQVRTRKVKAGYGEWGVKRRV